jgi:hypothetical protein
LWPRGREIHCASLDEEPALAKKKIRKVRKPERRAKRAAPKPKPKAAAARPAAPTPSPEADSSVSPLQAALARRRAALHGQLPS